MSKTLIADTNLSARAKNALTSDGYVYLEEVRSTPDQKLHHIPNFGPACLAEVRKAAPYIGHLRAFDEARRTIPEGQIKSANIAVADTMELGRKWLDDAGVRYTAADLTAYAALVQRAADKHAARGALLNRFAERALELAYKRMVEIDGDHFEPDDIAGEAYSIAYAMLAVSEASA